MAAETRLNSDGALSAVPRASLTLAAGLAAVCCVPFWDQPNIFRSEQLLFIVFCYRFYPTGVSNDGSALSQVFSATYSKIRSAPRSHIARLQTGPQEWDRRHE